MRARGNWRAAAARLMMARHDRAIPERVYERRLYAPGIFLSLSIARARINLLIPPFSPSRARARARGGSFALERRGAIPLGRFCAAALPANGFRDTIEGIARGVASL